MILTNWRQDDEWLAGQKLGMSANLRKLVLRDPYEQEVKRWDMNTTPLLDAHLGRRHQRRFSVLPRSVRIRSLCSLARLILTLL